MVSRCVKMSPKNLIAKAARICIFLPMITNLTVARALAQGKLILAVDASRTAADPFTLPAALKSLIEQDVESLENDDSETHAAEGNRSEATAKVRSALEKIETALRAGYAGIEALLSDELAADGISDAARQALFATYGWEKSQLGRFSDTRVLMLAELALQGSATVAKPAWRYSPAIITALTAQLSIIEAEEPEATGGIRQVSVAGRKSTLDLLEKRISRARYYYCSASDDLDSTKELAKISFQPRRPTSSPTPTPPAAPLPPQS